MSKNPDSNDLYILIGCISGLFIISASMAIWILNGFRTSIKKLFKFADDFMELKGRCDERHKKF